MREIIRAIEGVEAVIDALEAARVERIYKQLLDRIADRLYEAVIPQVPARLGTLRRSVGKRVTRRQAKAGPSEFYGRFVEFGTSRGVVGQHYMRDALAAARPGIERMAESAVEDFAEARVM